MNAFLQGWSLSITYHIIEPYCNKTGQTFLRINIIPLESQ